MQKEINKFLKKISCEKLKNNHKECIELYNIVGGLYTDIGSYDEAIHYHEQALETCKKIGDRLGTAVAFRYIGEARASLGQFYQAIDYTKKYLDLAEKTNNQVEIQRSWTTLGRVYLMQAQDMKENNKVIDDRIKEVAQEAEKRFQRALNLAHSIRDQVDEKEFAQMQSGLLINIGLVKDICGQHGESISRFNIASEICRTAKLKEDLYRCQIILAGIYRHRNNIKMAVKTSEEALHIAKQIGKKLLICDAYIENGLVKICQRDFKNAKRTFSQAYLEKSPNEDDHLKAIRLTKLTHLISVTYDKITRDSAPNESRLKLCDKLGDLFVAIGSYKLAIEFYKRAYTDARICSKPKNELARILFSIAETFADDGQYQQALVCYEKELTYRLGYDNEQCQSLIKIAHMHEYLNHDPERVCEAYEKAYEKADKNPKLMYNVLKYYVPYMRKKTQNNPRHRELNSVLENLKSYPEVIAEIENEDIEESNDLEDEIADIDDIITDDEDNDEITVIGRRKARGSKKFKANEVGDTPLHEAAIKGDLKRVKSLISQGHEVNPRDNAGWIPLHEACNHGHYEIVEFLIEHGADVCNRGLKGMSPLHDAATNGHFEIMRILIRNGANVIALTDSGETVLSCLRDFKKRNYSSMSNRVLSEYKQMEAELLSCMEKSGFNLMDENTKKVSSVGSDSVISLESTITQEKFPIPKRRLNVLETDPVSNPVKDYRDVIGTLKRKRLIEEPLDNAKKVNLPATYHSTTSTSAPTKEWLIDDVSREKRIERRRSNLQDLIEFEFSDNEDDDKNWDDNGDKNWNDNGDKNKDKIESEDEDEYVNEDKNEDEDEVKIIANPSCSTKSTNLSRAFNLFEKPLVVTIEDRRLLIPIKDEFATIKWLTETIVERYSAVANAKPTIHLAPISAPNCIIFDGDLCKDVLMEDVLAIVDSWNLEPIEMCYAKNCANINLNPLDFVQAELRRINEIGDKLDLSCTRFPKNHIKPLTMALARRDFKQVNLSGAVAFLEWKQNGYDIMETIATWKRLTRLNLKCFGLGTSHFETICSKMKFPELESLDVSFNSIAYKCKNKFKSLIEKLLKSSPNLKRLDMRKNLLEPVKSICSDDSFFYDLEILLADQKDYSIYSE